MWNAQLVALLRKCSVAMFDFAPNYPDFLELWRKVDSENLTYFGAGAAFFNSCMKSNIVPKNEFNFEKLRSIGATGSPLSQEDLSGYIRTLNRIFGWRLYLEGPILQAPL